MKEAALYVRTGSVNNDELSKQLAELESYCDNNGYHVFDRYIDNGCSGLSESRPKLDKMISDCQEGLIDCVLFTTADRLARGVKTFYTIVNKMSGVPCRTIYGE